MPTADVVDVNPESSTPAEASNPAISTPQASGSNGEAGERNQGGNPEQTTEKARPTEAGEHESAAAKTQDPQQIEAEIEQAFASYENESKSE